MKNSESNRSAAKKHYWLYALELEGGNYYVGITRQTPEARFQEHRTGTRAAYWTEKYKPLSIHHRQDLGEISKRQAEQAENRAVRKYMLKFGAEKVQGGDLTDKSDVFVMKRRRIYLQRDWSAITTTLFLLAIIALLVILQTEKH